MDDTLMVPKRNLVIMGTGGFALELAALLPTSKFDFLGFVGPKPDSHFNLQPWLGEDEIIADFTADTRFCIAIGEPTLRHKIADRVTAAGGKLGKFIHPSAQVAKNATLHTGVMLYPNSTIHARVQLGDGVLVNSNVSIGHETKIEQFVNINPGVSVGGRCLIGERAYVGIGATIINNISICPEAIIGAGATVVKNIDIPGKYVGTPARRLAV